MRARLPVAARAFAWLGAEARAQAASFDWPGTERQALERFAETCLGDAYDQATAIGGFQRAGWRDINADVDMFLFVGPRDEPPVFLNQRGGRDACGVVTNFDNGPALGDAAQAFMEKRYAGRFAQDDARRSDQAVIVVRTWTPIGAKRGLRIELVAHSSQAYAGLRALRDVPERGGEVDR